MSKIKEILIERISNSGGNFNDNDLWQISWDLNVDKKEVENILNILVSMNVIKKKYYSPNDGYRANIPIGDDSIEIFSIKLPSIDIEKLIS